MPPTRTAKPSALASSSAAAAPGAAKPKKRDAIDDIFAMPASSAAAASSKAETSASGAAEGASRKKKKKTKSSEGAADATTSASASAPAAPKARKPIEIVDPSLPSASALPPQSRAAANEEDLAFMDTRGTRKRTEDNLRIFTEEELGLTKNLTGGGTTLCPFDCDCCF